MAAAAAFARHMLAALAIALHFSAAMAAAAPPPARNMLAASAIALPGYGGREHNTNESGTGTQCDKFDANASDLFNATIHSLNCISTYTVDSQIFLTMWTTACVGALCFFVFCWGQSFVSVYRARLLSPQVALKPPVLNDRSFVAKYFGWLWVVVSMTESELLATAGMDALMFERLIIFCLQFITPVMVIAVSALIPIHLKSNYSSTNPQQSQQFARSDLMALTMGNLAPDSSILWVHFVLVVLFTAYGMWLLDQHYKSYMLLRQQYLTRGDSLSASLGNTPKQRHLASHGSQLVMDRPTQEDLLEPMWTFARAKASDSDQGSGLQPSTKANSLHGAAAGAGAAATAAGGSGDGLLQTKTAAAGAAAGAAGEQGNGSVLFDLVGVEEGSNTAAAAAAQQQQKQRVSAGQLRTYALSDLQLEQQHSQELVQPLYSAAAAAAGARPTPFARFEQQEMLQPDTLQMVQLSDIVFHRSGSLETVLVENESVVGPLRRNQSAAAGMRSGAAGLEGAVSPSGSSSATGSRLTSRQSSGHALLTPQHIDSSSVPAGDAAAAAAAQQQRRAGGPFGGFLPRGSSKSQHLRSLPEQAAAAGAMPGEGEPLASAAGAVSEAGASRGSPKCFGGCGAAWRRVSCRSTDEDAPVGVTFADDAGDGGEAEQERRRKAAARAAEFKAAARAARVLGADVEWQQFKTGDILLDRHIVQLDMDEQLGPAGQDHPRPYYWWQLAPGDSSSAAGSGPNSSSSGVNLDSNIQPVPRTSLLFDRRSLRARRPSVRFRNTVHVRGFDGALMPLHVSTYAVLVTDVPDPDVGRRSSSSTCSYDLGPGKTLCGPFADACSSLMWLLDHALQFACWGWPCLLSRADLTKAAQGWSHASLKSTHSMIIPQSTDELAKLEAGMLLAGELPEAPPKQQQQQGQQQGQQPQQQRWQQLRRDMWSVRGMERPSSRQRLVELTFRHLFPGEVQAVIPAQEFKSVNELLREWNRKTLTYMHTAALLELKRQRKQRKEKQAAAAAAAAAMSSSTRRHRPPSGAGGAAAGGAGQQQQQQQVCIEVTQLQQHGEKGSTGMSGGSVGHTAPAQGGSGGSSNGACSSAQRSSADAAAASGLPLHGSSSSRQHMAGSSGSGAGTTDAAAAAAAAAAGAAAAAAAGGGSSSPSIPGPSPGAPQQQPSMSRPRSRSRSGNNSSSSNRNASSPADPCSGPSDPSGPSGAAGFNDAAAPGFSDAALPGFYDDGLYDDESDEELGCCAAATRRLCTCRCCGVGAIQDGGHGLLPPQDEGRRRWCFGLFGPREKLVQAQPPVSEDVLAEKREELLELEERIRAEQKKVLAGPDTGNFIVLFKTPQAATLAAHSAVYPHTGAVEAFKVQPAPSPEDVLWPSLWASPSDRRNVMGIVVFWYNILYLIPTGFFAASLNAITLTMCSSSEFGRSMGWFCHSRLLQFLVTIVTPYILLIVWQNAVIPAQFYRLELRRAVAVSLSEMERRLLMIYCGWELVNIFLGGVLSGSLVSQVQTFLRHPEAWAQILGAAIPQTSNFFLNYVVTRAFMMNFVRLLMPHGGMWRWIGQMLFTGFTGVRHAATASYRACIIYPASIRYGREPGLVLLILLIGTAYCVAAPLITVFVFAYMVTAYIVWRYQVIYVCVRAYESGGKMWPAYFLCIEYCLGFFAAFTSSMLIFKKANIQGVLVLVLLPVLYLFHRRCRQRYCSKVDHPPLWLAHSAPRSEIDPLVYVPPCLQPNAQGWFFEAGKPWLRWGVPAYNNPKKPGHDDGACFC